MIKLNYYKPIALFYKDIYSRFEKEMNLTETQKQILKLILEEWCTNLIKYSGFTSVTITLDEDDNHILILSFLDDGVPYNPLLCKAKTDYSIPGGLGISLIRAYSKDIKYRYTEDSYNNMEVYI